MLFYALQDTSWILKVLLKQKLQISRAVERFSFTSLLMLNILILRIILLYFYATVSLNLCSCSSKFCFSYIFSFFISCWMFNTTNIKICHAPLYYSVKCFLYPYSNTYGQYCEWVLTWGLVFFSTHPFCLTDKDITTLHEENVSTGIYSLLKYSNDPCSLY